MNGNHLKQTTYDAKTNLCLCGSNTDSVIVVLIGLPGSGKTTFGHALLRAVTCESDCSQCCVDVEVVSFDDFVYDPNFHVIYDDGSAVNKPTGRPPKPEACNDTKDRHTQCGSLEQEMSGTKAVQPAGEAGEADNRSWRLQREQVLHQISLWMTSSKQPASDKCRKKILIVDDNMYYTSMRYQVYQMARQSAIGFAQVFFECPVDIAVERDATRTSHRVGAHVIRRMNARIEAPKPVVNSWEEHSVVVPHTQTLSLSRRRAPTAHPTNGEKPPATSHLADSGHAFGCVWQIIAAAFSSPAVPLVPPEVSAKQVAKARAETAKSAIHAFDVASRKLLASALKKHKAAAADIVSSAGTLKIVAKELNTLRKRALSGFSGKLRTAEPASIGVEDVLEQLDRDFNAVVRV